MTREDVFAFWDFNAPITDDSVVRCPDHDCRVASPLASWREGKVYCELCGDHSAMVCPACGQHFDQIGRTIFEVVACGRLGDT